MKLSKIVVAGAVSLTMAFAGVSTAAAKDAGYVGVGAIQWSSTVSGLPKYEATTWRLRGGINLNEHFALELHAAAGGSEEEVTGIEHELHYLAGAFLKAQTATARDMRLYGLLGVSHAEVNHINPFVEGDVRDTGLSYGVGLEVLLMGGFSLKVDATRYLDVSDQKLDAVGAELGLRW